MAIELQEYVGATAIEVTAPLSKISLQEGYTQTYIDENSLSIIRTCLFYEGASCFH